jgi:hypothetical protein
MMADHTVHVRVTHVAALATCEVCSTLVSWKRAWQDLDQVSALRCPHCGGSCEVMRDSGVMLLEVGGGDARMVS